ncbi:MAG: histidine--tRNA ligase [Acidobacteria bacterium]|nr:MAG: histidine--tRNA ligase [Acidobacteriota bacterium]
MARPPDPGGRRRLVGRRLQSLRGFHDILPGQTERWQRLEQGVHRLMHRYGFREIRPPHLERTELFVRSVGEATDIVGKEMFTFLAGDESVSLRPEITASVCRAFIEHGLDRRGLTRLYYLGPAFRRERPQKGRLRQFHQVGIEVFGEPAPEADAEAIVLATEFVRQAGVGEFRLHVNSLGDRDCRPRYRAALLEALEARAPALCRDCRDRMNRNPLRVLDCKNESCQAALDGLPRALDHLCEPCRRHFEAVVDALGQVGVEPLVDPRLVRGLDYYVRTAFEIRSAALGAQNAVLGGGRYDGLVAALGGPDVPGLGWAAGIERLLLAAGADSEEAARRPDVYLVTLGEEARRRAFRYVQSLRARGLAVLWDTSGHGLGGQMKRAGRSGARYAVLIGEEELARERVTLKDLDSGEQTEAPLEPAALAAKLLGTRKDGGDGE